VHTQKGISKGTKRDIAPRYHKMYGYKLPGKP